MESSQRSSLVYVAVVDRRSCFENLQPRSARLSLPPQWENLLETEAHTKGNGEGLRRLLECLDPTLPELRALKIFSNVSEKIPFSLS
jgi:hypothetical protein